MSPKWAPGEAQKGLPEGQNEPPEAPGADVIKMSSFLSPQSAGPGAQEHPGTHPRGPQEGPGRPECMHFTCCSESLGFHEVLAPLGPKRLHLAEVLLRELLPNRRISGVPVAEVRILRGLLHGRKRVQKEHCVKHI